MVGGGCGCPVRLHSPTEGIQCWRRRRRFVFSSEGETDIRSPGHTPGAPQGLSDFSSAPPSGYSTPARPAVQQQVTSSQIFAPVQQQQQRQQSFAAPAAPLQQQRQEEEAYQSQTFRHVRRRLSHFPPSCTLAPSPTNCTIVC
jgi:hypothetical protein